MSVDKTYSDLVRALEAISRRTQDANDAIVVEKVGSTVEYFRALVEAQKETSKKQHEAGLAKVDLDFQTDTLPLPGLGSEKEGSGDLGSGDSWISMIPSNEFLDLLKNAKTFSSANSTNHDLSMPETVANFRDHCHKTFLLQIMG